MDLDGDEKRIRALFSELSLADQNHAPQFAHVWTRAQAIGEPRPNSFRRPVLLTALVIVATSSLAVWSWYRFTPSTPPGIVNPQGTIAEATPKTTLEPEPERVQPRRKVRRQRTDRRIANEAALLSSWQSPTQSFMASPTALIPGSLPQLNQSVKDLESFLPKDNEIMKESNQ